MQEDKRIHPALPSLHACATKNKCAFRYQNTVLASRAEAGSIRYLIFHSHFWLPRGGWAGSAGFDDE
jgi:hypothetical protein